MQLIPHNVKKKECINHVQKRMGTRLRNCKKGQKGLGGMGKLTGKLIEDLTLYYGLAIRRNSNSVEDMRKDIWATFYHKCSTDETPQHHHCPEGEDSWCSWQQASAKGTLDAYKHKRALPEDVVDVIKPICEDLSNDDLLERCLGAFNQNNNESLNAVIWKFAPKTLFSGTSVIHTAANIATVLFNDGHMGLLNILEELDISIGETLYQYCQRIDEERIRKAERRAQQSTHEDRLKKKTRKKRRQ